MILGIDANGRTFHWAFHERNLPGGVRRVVVGNLPEYSDEHVEWTNISAKPSLFDGGILPIELAWMGLARGNKRYIWTHTDDSPGQISAADAIAQAVAANTPVLDPGCTSALVIPNRLDEAAQEALLRALKTVGILQPRLIWRPVAIALSWLDGRDKGITIPPALWVVDLESDCLTVTRLGIVPHRKDAHYMCPLRACPDFTASEHTAKWSYRLAARQHIGIPACGGDRRCAAGLLWGPEAERYQALLESPHQGADVFYNDQNMRWHRVDRVSVDRESESSMARAAKLVESLMKGQRIKPTERDLILLHGALAQRVYKDNPALRSSHYPHLRTELIDVDSAARGAAIYAKRAFEDLLTYQDTLPEYSVWTKTPKGFGWKQLIAPDVVDGGDVWRMLGKAEYEELRKSFSVAKQMHTFTLNVRRSPASKRGEYCRKLPTRLPTMLSENIPVTLDATIKPASGFARVTLQAQNDAPVFGGSATLELSWDEAIVEPEHLGYLPAREVVGRIMDSPEHRELGVLFAGWLHGEAVDCDRLAGLYWGYRKGWMKVGNDGVRRTVQQIRTLLNEHTHRSVDPLLENLLVPWGYHWQLFRDEPTRGLFGSRAEADDEFRVIAQRLYSGIQGCAAVSPQDRYKFCNCLFRHVPEEFVEDILQRIEHGNVNTWNQVYAVGRTVAAPEWFARFLVAINEGGFVQPDDSYVERYWWAFFRCLCYHDQTADVPEGGVLAFLQAMTTFINHNGLQHQERKFALHAVLFALRLRSRHPGFLSPDDNAHQTLAALIEQGRLAGERFPPTMLAGMRNVVHADDNFSKYVLRFLRKEDTLLDRELGAGLATS